MRRSLWSAAVALCCGFSTQMLYADAPSVGTRLGSGEYPAISGELVVWYADKGIYVHDLATRTTKQITSLVLAGTSNCVGGSSHPDIHGDLIVWDDHIDTQCSAEPGYDVFACRYDRATGACPVHQITTHPASQFAPKVSSTGLIVWTDRRNRPLNPQYSNNDIYGCVYDPQSGACPERQLTSDLQEQFAPSVSGNQVAWHDVRNVYQDIFTCTFDPATGACPNVQITSKEANWGYPAIAGNRIATWLWGRGPNSPPYGVYAFDVTQPMAAPQLMFLSPFSSGSGASEFNMDGDRVVWRQVNEVYQHDFVTQQTTALTRGTRPDISGDRVVFVFLENPNTVKSAAVYMIGPLPPPPAPALGPNLVTNGGFEQGRLHWGGFGLHRFLTTETASEGAIAVKFVLQGKMQKLMHRQVPVTAGTRYQPQVAIKTVNAACGDGLSSPAMGRLVWIRADGGRIGPRQSLVGPVPSTADWQPYSTGHLTAPAGAAFAQIKLVTCAGSGSAYFDDVRLQEVLP